MDTQSHISALAEIVEQHFQEAEGRQETFYETYLASPSSIFSRHWRNKKDVPRDLAALPRKLYGLGKKVFRLPVDQPPMSAKERELQQLIQEELLDLPGLQNKIQRYCQPFEQDFQDQLSKLDPSKMTEEQQQHFQHQLKQQIDKLTIPQEGAREALLFTVTGMIGRVASDKVAFGSALGTGSAVATSLYISQQSWLAVMWLKLTGVPGWVGAVGMAGGVATLLLIAPIISPVLEIGVNRFRGRKVVANIVKAAKAELTEQGTDKVNLIGTTATYLQALPDVLQLLKNIKL